MKPKPKCDNGLAKFIKKAREIGADEDKSAADQLL
jgi:hypothetical protein